MDFKLNWLSGICIKVPNGDPVFIISVYLPFQCSENEEEFLMKLGILFSIMNDHESDYILVMGDFNTNIGASPSRFGDLRISNRLLC